MPSIADAGPQGWTSIDVGAVGLNGTATENSGLWTIQGAGADIWGSADAFQFVYRNTLFPLNGRMTVRVDDLQNTDPFAKVGLMVRTGLASGAATIILDMKPNGEIEFMTRPAEGADMVYLGGASVTAPAWLRLEWFPSGSNIVASVSQDNTNWTPIGTARFNVVGYAGVAVTSHTGQQLTTAHVEGLSLVPLDWTVADVGETGLTGNTVVVDPAGRAFSLQGAGADIGGFADGFQFLYKEERNLMASLQARILSQAPINALAKAGLMFRNTTAPDAAFVMLDIKQSGELEFVQRDTDGGAVQYLGGAMPGFTWLRLVRNASTITGSASTDGVDWTQIGTTDVDLAASAKLGLAVTSDDVSALNTVALDNVSVVNASPGPTITFDGLTTNGAPVTSYTESGFTVDAISGDWVAVTTYGNPAPFIDFTAAAGTTVTGEIRVTSDGTLFGFESVDAYSSTTPIPYTITGLRDSSVVFTLSDTLPNTFGGFRTIVNPTPDVFIDTLSVALTNPSAPCCANPTGLDTIVLRR